MTKSILYSGIMWSSMHVALYYPTVYAAYQPVESHERDRKYSLKCYSRVFQKLLPRFHKYVIHEVPAGSGSKATIIGVSRLKSSSYALELGSEMPGSSMEVREIERGIGNTVDSLWWIARCVLMLPVLSSSKRYYVPYNVAEVYFIVSRELAHLARATAIRYQVELDPIHYPELQRNIRYRYFKKCNTYENDELALYGKLWSDRLHKHSLSTIMLAIKRGGAWALRGGITYTARLLIYAYYSKEVYNKCFVMNRTCLRYNKVVIREQRDIMHTMLSWLTNQLTMHPKIDGKASRARELVNSYYSYWVKESPMFNEISPRHQEEILNLGNVVRLK